MIILETEAIEELREIGRWYAKHRPDAAQRYFADLRGTLRRIEESPHSFAHVAGDARAQSARFGRYPYRIVYYLAKSGVVHVVAFAHDKRRPLYWKGRLRELT